MDVTCAGCGKSFEAKTTRAKWCGDVCRKRGQRTPAARATATSTRTRRATATAGNEVLKATRAELKALGKTATLEGRQAILLATRIADPGETGASVARMVEQLQRHMQLLRSTTSEGDPVEAARAKARQGVLRLIDGGAS